MKEERITMKREKLMEDLTVLGIKLYLGTKSFNLKYLGPYWHWAKYQGILVNLPKKQTQTHTKSTDSLYLH